MTKKIVGFSGLFKLSPSKVALAFGLAQRKGSTEGIRLLCAPSTTTGTFLIAITRTVKGSVIRNVIRRRIKAIIHSGIKTNGPLPAGTWLCVVYPTAANRSYQELSLFITTAVWRTIKPA